ncbi:MAG: hypothetical protein JWM11_564 [Planctomycetaceae bacterium]|nr:hypothetical protein [Planctomycetaceae bacterium]
MLFPEAEIACALRSFIGRVGDPKGHSLKNGPVRGDRDEETADLDDAGKKRLP